jgi:hypothetical protein
MELEWQSLTRFMRATQSNLTATRTFALVATTIHPCLTFKSRKALPRVTVQMLMIWRGQKTVRGQNVLLVMMTMMILIYYRH